MPAPGTPLAALLADLARELPPDLPGRERILAEVEDHLSQSVEALMRDGLSPELVEREAVARFGDPSELAVLLRSLANERGYGRDLPLSRWQLAASWAALASGLVAVAGLTALAAWALLDPDLTSGRESRALALLGAAILAFAVSGITLMRQRRDIGGRLRLAVVTAVALVPLGAAAVIETIQLGQQTGDYEWYGAGIGLALIAQGLLAAWLLRDRRRTAS
jgi:hypothetical protein